MNDLFKTKLHVLCLLVFFLPLWSYAQSDVRITIGKGTFTVKEALQRVERQSQMSVAYNESKINGNKEVAVDIVNRPLDEALHTILAGSGFTYQIKDSYIMIVPEPDILQHVITGNVTDRYGAPLVGASVVVKGTSKATAADVDGRYTITGIEAGQVLVFSFLGYNSREITIGNETTYNVALNETIATLNEVVITALGIKRAERALSYNVQQIGMGDITTVKNTNFINSLAGKVAGVSINTGSSGVGGATKVVMRGSKSIEQSNNALYVIDGIPMYNNRGAGNGGRGDEFGSGGVTDAIADINPEDIESISVLTGAAAAALYGNQGANGAIVITTKKGLTGKLEVNFSSNTEFLTPLVLPRFQNRYGTGDLLTDGGSPIKSWGRLSVPENYQDYDPASDFFETGTVFTNTVSIATGNEKNQTYASVAAVNSNGIIPNNQYDRYNFTFRNTSTFLDDKMTLDVGGSYIMQKDQNMINNGVYSNPLSSAYLFPRGDDFDMVRVFERYDASRRINTQYWPQGEGDFRLQNPYWIAYRNLKNNDRKRYMLNASLSYDILDWLNVTARARMDNTHNEYTEKLYASTNATLAATNGRYSSSKLVDRQTYADVLVNINKRLEDFSIVVNAGASISDNKYDELAVGGNIREDGIPNVFNVFQLDKDNQQPTQDGWQTQSQAIFASAEIGYKSAYYLTLTGRNDWESALAGTETTSFFYPSVGISTVLSEILPLPRQVEYLKVRAAYTQVGTPIPRNISTPTYVWNNSTGSWATESIYPIRVFKPESTSSWEVGLSARFLRHFSLDFSWYHTNTVNQTFQPPLSVSSGYSTIYMQTGNVQNTGIETALNYANQWGNFSWSTNVVFGLNRNRIIELVNNGIHPQTGQVINIDRMVAGGMGQALFILKPGGSLGDLYSTQDLKRDSNGQIYVDADGKVQVTNVDDIYLGSVFPKSNLSWRNDFEWRRFHLSAMVSARFGGVVYSATQAALDAYGVSETSAIARDNGGVIINGGDRLDAQIWYTTVGASSGIPQYYTYSATNVRLQELSFGYTFPRSMIGNVADLSVSLVANNLWMIYCKAPFDPETVATTGNYFQGIDHFMMPNLRSIGFNIKLTF
ncbi:MAG: SusC/RagA family TonB-linked outer membrane protein [Prevotellaceae bacterium]|jgi:TonB-linked SusC/RagA family outer membrane protein|nr:SusC/RagA family TonB-linked outer membrane protein [Prevotellaceae bacterium]